jgi:hypothetical protein
MRRRRVVVLHLCGVDRSCVIAAEEQRPVQELITHLAVEALILSLPTDQHNRSAAALRAQCSARGSCRAFPCVRRARQGPAPPACQRSRRRGWRPGALGRRRPGCSRRGTCGKRPCTKSSDPLTGRRLLSNHREGARIRPCLNKNGRTRATLSPARGQPFRAMKPIDAVDAGGFSFAPSGTLLSDARQLHAWPKATKIALAFLWRKTLQRRIVQHGVTQQPLQLAALFFQSPKTLRLRHVHAAELSLPALKYGLRDAVLADQVTRLHPAFMLLQHSNDLLRRKPGSSSIVPLLPKGRTPNLSGGNPQWQRQRL